MISSFLWNLVIVGLAIWILVRVFGGKRGAGWLERLVMVQEKITAEAFFLLGAFLLWVTLTALNRESGNHLSQGTVLLAGSLAALAVSYAATAVSPLMPALLGLAGWWGWKATTWIEISNVRPGTVLAVLAFYYALLAALGTLHDGKRHVLFRRVYYLLGFAFFSGSLFFFSTRVGLEALERMTRGAHALTDFRLGLSLVVTGLAAAVVTGTAVARGKLARTEAAALAFFTILLGGLALVPLGKLSVESILRNPGSGLTGAGIAVAVLLNVSAFAGLVGLVLTGYARREESLVSLGAWLLFAFIIVKYFDWFFAFLDKSLFFLLAGLLLVGLGWFMERARRRVIDSMAAEGDDGS